MGSCYFCVCIKWERVLRYQPLVFLYAVQRNKWNENRNGLHIFLIFRIVSVIFILADLEASRTAEHDEDDADITDENYCPLSDAGDSADAGKKDTGPEDHLTKVIRTANQAIKAGINEASRI